MNSIQNIQQKLEKFLRKYYTNELIKGVLLFVGIGLVYFILTALLEYFLWFGTTGRLILFWLFVLVEMFLFVKFIVNPLLYLFKIRKGIDYKTASSIIGNHFPEVDDKLLNILQLSDNTQQSELLLASIQQKSERLSPIPFQSAINFKSNLKYLWYALAPIFFILIVIFLGKSNLFTDSYKRVVDYKTAYTPPAPFEFFILNDSLTTLEGKNYTLRVRVAGKLIPDNIQIAIDNNLYYLQEQSLGEFEYQFAPTSEAVDFKLTANSVTSQKYTLRVIPTPTLVNFEMKLNYPSYTEKKSEIIKSTGNAIIPEGTEITWQLQTAKTKEVSLQLADTTLFFQQKENNFQFSKNIYNNTNYTIATSNENLKNYEKLGFSISVVKDQFPEIKVEEKTDSLNLDSKVLLAQVSDDYKVDKVEIVYAPQGTDSIQKVEIPIKKSSYDRFVYAFPNNLNLKEGTNYEYYFEVTDNDKINGGKTTKSNVFNYRKLTKSEKQNNQLAQQKEGIKKLENSLEKAVENEKELQEINNINKQKEQLNFNDQKKIENFLERQKQQDELMKRYHKDLAKNLEEFREENKEKSEMNKLLQERIERQQKELEKNEKLMEELQEVADKINKEELTKKLDELGKQQKKDSRNLEQILELTKRYYTSAKAEKIKNDLKDLAEKQKAQSEKSSKENTAENQEKLNEEFNKIKEEIDALEKQNDALQQPMDLGTDAKKEEDVSKEQQEATDKLEEQEQNQSKSEGNQGESPAGEQAKQKQQNAAKKMEEMSVTMQGAMQGGEQENTAEDAAMLRQILDNLLVFSFDQEDIMKRLENYEGENLNLSVYLKKQKDLRTLFEHVDDSLFTLSLRQPMLSETINKNITDIYYNIDKTLEEFAENRFYQGISHQQYTLTSTNELADFLSESLDQMQQNMSMSASGSGGGFQLPDIIQSQKQLNEQMEKGMKKGEDGENSEEKNGNKQGEQNKQLGNEKMSGELFEIYKQQQQLRNQLEQQLNNLNGEGSKQSAKKLAQQMEQIENDLLEKGFNRTTQQKMLQLQHQLLKLEDATLKQGQDQQRESQTNTQTFQNEAKDNLPELQQYFNEVEILNRQALPLRQNYKQKVNAYFKGDD
ncbi:hypothetical protein [Joostella sp. CR20]|uniref:hypothetical protein n=1 Tax=Joostella sp. CR20 TaxID=2804312 RepID=UPI00313AECD5